MTCHENGTAHQCWLPLTSYIMEQNTADKNKDQRAAKMVPACLCVCVCVPSKSPLLLTRSTLFISLGFASHSDIADQLCEMCTVIIMGLDASMHKAQRISNVRSPLFCTWPHGATFSAMLIIPRACSGHA